MEYPQGFPTHLQPPIEAAIAEADIEFVKAKKRLRLSCFGNDHAVDKLIMKFVKKVFVAFAGQARQAVAEGLWTGERVRSALDDFLNKLVVESYHRKNTHSGPLLELLESDATRRMEQEVRESSEWVEHQEALAALARAQAATGSLQHAKAEKGNGKSAIADKRSPRCGSKLQSRALWVSERLRERGWNKHDLERHGGPDHKTVQRVLDGVPVREDVLGKLANALSMKKTKVDLLDIPQN